MRPDEHKKKKSAQYQRKHGSSGAKGEKNANKASSSKQGTSSRNEGAPDGRSDHHKKIESSSESDEDGEARDTKPKTFRRREIASNWAKYDLPPADVEEASATPKGQDFHKLLQSAGSAMSHFRFKDEEGWEEDGGGEGGPAAQVLSLDCAELAMSLNCVPLYTQLGLDTQIFTSEQITAMEKTAEENRKLAGLPARSQKREINNGKAASKSQSSSAVPTLPADSSGSFEPAESQAAPGSGKDRVQSTIAPQSVVAQIEEMPMKKGDSVQGKPVETEPRSSEGFTDADLDSLLECDDVADQPKLKGQGHVERSPAAAVNQRSSEQQGCSDQASAACQEVTEQDLDALLDMESPQSSRSATVPNTSPQKNNSNMATESAELEDWLDSVLDD